jgi:mannose-1-phosphate guanylyltransferase
MYAFSPSVLDDIPVAPPRDIGFDLLPRLIGRARTVELGAAYFLDIGNPAALERGRLDWEGRALQ